MWSVNKKNPDDDWRYDMKGNIHRQCQFLIANNLVRPPACPICNGETTPVSEPRNKIPYKWKCIDSSCNGSCRFLSNSYLSRYKISLFKHIQLLYKFYRKRDAQQCHEETGIGYGTCKGWFRWYRKCISKYMTDYYYPQFTFDVDMIIEGDEAALSAKQKHHRGRYREPVWVFGAVQRDSNVCMLKVIEKKNAPTLHSLITSVTVAGAVIITDGWRGYLGLSNHGLFHWTCDHSSHFVNPYHGHHTNTIESLWALIRGDLRASCGIKASDLQQHLDVWAFRRNMTVTNDDGLWIAMCCAIGAIQDLVPKPNN